MSETETEREREIERSAEHVREKVRVEKGYKTRCGMATENCVCACDSDGPIFN